MTFPESSSMTQLTRDLICQTQGDWESRRSAADLSGRTLHRRAAGLAVYTGKGAPRRGLGARVRERERERSRHLRTENAAVGRTGRGGAGAGESALGEGRADGDAGLVEELPAAA